MSGTSLSREKLYASQYREMIHERCTVKCKCDYQKNTGILFEKFNAYDRVLQNRIYIEYGIYVRWEAYMPGL